MPKPSQRQNKTLCGKTKVQKARSVPKLKVYTRDKVWSWKIRAGMTKSCTKELGTMPIDVFID